MLQGRSSWPRASLIAGLLLMLCIGLVTPGGVFAQMGTLRGKVTDAQSGDPLPGANVVVTAAGVETGSAASASGEYEVKGLAAGTYTVSVSFIGYEKKTIADVAVAAGESKTINIALTPSGIQFNPLVVSASRRQEKALEAPAAITVLEAPQIRGRVTGTTATDYLRGVPAVDISTNGIAQSNVAVRGFNGIFTGSLLSLTDNRYANVPSLRANVYSLLPLTGDDVSRIELVSGPGSALYGPNSANGVMHIITRSPFESEGTTVSISGGGRDFFNVSSRAPTGARNIYSASFRHAGQTSEKFGYKISGSYFEGRDWESYLDVDVAPREGIKYKQTSEGRIPVGDSLIIQGDFNVQKFGGEARFDFRFNDNTSLIFNGGLNQISQIELTGIGAAQGIDWNYYYAQARFNYKNLFMQAFVNGSDAGDTFILRTGDLITDQSKLYAGQIQHSTLLGERQRFTYGADAILTRPDSKGTIYGRNEGNTDINEYGAYLQSETNVSSKLDLVLAARLDDHNLFEDAVFSPRAALVFKPTAENNFRLTYNRAYSTPATQEFFLDILSASVPSPLPPPFPRTLIAIRAQGVGSSGFTFRRGSDGRPLMYSQLTPGAGYVPANVNTVWPALRQILIGGAPAQLQPLLNATLPPPNQLAPTAVLGDLRALNSSTGGFDLVSDVKDVTPLKPQITTTYEFGYKGILGKKLLVAVDLYHTRIKDFTRLATASQTPNVFANPQQFAAALQPTAVAITQALIAQGVPPAQATAQAAAIVGGLVASAAQLPLGVISPEQVQNDTDVILTYQPFGQDEISLNGMDVAFSYYATPNWVFAGNYSFATEQGFNLFQQPNRVYYPQVDGVADVAYNAPGNKASLSIQYRKPERGYDVEVRGRYVEGFPMRTGVYQDEIQTYTLWDLNWGYDLPFSQGTHFVLSVQNIADKKHREFGGAPELGRMILARLTQSW